MGNFEFMRTLQHLAFWFLVGGFLVITFAQADGDYITSFYYVTFLLPVAVATSYFFNYFLVPRYLLTRRYTRFALYLVYTLIFSLYFEMLVLTVSFIVLANYQYQNLNPYTTNPLLITSTIYFIVFVNAFVLLIKRYQRKEHQLGTLHADLKRNELQQIQIKVNRQTVPVNLEEILYLESLADYVKIHTTNGQLITKEKISELQAKLPDQFVRVHRSFIVNRQQVTSFRREELLVGEVTIPISRTYRKEAVEGLES